MIPTIPDHVHVWTKHEGVNEWGGRSVSGTCARCDDPLNRIHMPGSLRNKVLAARRKARHLARAEPE